jgi:hypothetical protein
MDGLAMHRVRPALTVCAAVLGGWALGAAAPARAAPAACDTDRVATLVQQTVPEYEVLAVREEGGIVTLLLTRRGAVGTFAVALHAVGTKLYTEMMGAQLDDSEHARISTVVVGWYDNATLRDALLSCGAAHGGTEEYSNDRLRGDVETALSGHERVSVSPASPGDARRDPVARSGPAPRVGRGCALRRRRHRLAPGAGGRRGRHAGDAARGILVSALLG